jgi:hypothetical protein
LIDLHIFAFKEISFHVAFHASFLELVSSDITVPTIVKMCKRCHQMVFVSHFIKGIRCSNKLFPINNSVVVTVVRNNRWLNR